MNEKILIGSWIRRFLLEHLLGERNLSRNTQRSYRDMLCLLIPFVSKNIGKQVDRVTVTDVTSELARRFLGDLEERRRCGVSTRNQRLAALRAFARFVGQSSPEHLEWCGQICAIPFKKATRTQVTYLEKPEMDALLAAPDR